MKKVIMLIILVVSVFSGCISQNYTESEPTTSNYTNNFVLVRTEYLENKIVEVYDDEGYPAQCWYITDLKFNSTSLSCIYM